MKFIDVIQCACTDTFQSAYPQCVDCFTQTNQTAFLVPQNGQSLPLHPDSGDRFGSCGLVSCNGTQSMADESDYGRGIRRVFRVDVIIGQSSQAWFTQGQRFYMALVFTTPIGTASHLSSSL